VDHSNVTPSGGPDQLLLLPRDPDASAAQLRDALQTRFDVDLAVVVSDSFGRAWRRGTVGVAIGSAGLPALVDMRGKPDLFGRTLEVTVVGFGDEIAAAAGLLMGQADEGRPVVLMRGLRWSAPVVPASELIRPPAEDLFR
jgi:coenzyme F420-0:L-glutamate ligase/coenzyme F420-1:gamma-L-glutamate ligase